MDWKLGIEKFFIYRHISKLINLTVMNLNELRTV